VYYREFDILLCTFETIKTADELRTAVWQQAKVRDRGFGLRPGCTLVLSVTTARRRRLWQLFVSLTEFDFVLIIISGLFRVAAKGRVSTYMINTIKGFSPEQKKYTTLN